MPRVLICDKLESSGTDMLARAGLEVDNRPGLKGEELQSALRAADGCILRSGTRITADLLEDPGKLRAIARAGVGVDNIDVPAATRNGIVVMNTPGGNTVSAAEHTIALLLALARHIPAADAGMKAGRWDRNKFVGTQVAGKTLGVIGLGRIGREVARRAAGLDMTIVGFDPFLSPDKAAEYGITATSNVDELLPQCDFITVHTPLTDETRNLIGKPQFGKLKPGVRLVNVARGGIYDESALAEGLQSGVIAGAALDVFQQEPPPADCQLLKSPNIVLTPHLGASTVEAQDAVAREAAQLLIDYLTRGVVQFAVNAAAVDRAEMESLKHYVDLARRLGMLHAQMDQGSIRKATLTYRGEIAGRATRLLTAAFAAGLLEYRLVSVNMVNSELLARERGIELVEVKNPTAGDFGSLITAEVTTDKKAYTAAGTLFGQQMLRLVQVGPHRLDAYLDGVMLIFTHQDQPGLIGHIGTALGRHNVNIAAMSVGRRTPGGEAIAVLNLDAVPPEAAIAELREHALISSASVVKLPAPL
ncbi:MAG: phosphoglycerate dehydrogenase [Gemmataceae bacterium]|nr:phosphoglycerate dehydrogenase [Gemmataceae bacterium]